MTFGTGGDQGGSRSGGFDFMVSTDSRPRGGVTSPGSQQQTRGGSGNSPRRRRGARVDTGAIVRSLVVAVLAVGVVIGAGVTAYSKVQDAESKVKADSAAFCTDIAATPGVLSEPGFGWPTDSAAGIGGSLEAMKLYQARWQNLATVGPPTMRRDLEAIATAATKITTSVEGSNTIDRAGNLAAMDRVTSQTALRSWAKKYCS